MKQSHTITKAKQKASRLLQARQLEQAQEAYERISRMAPADHEAWLNLGAIAAMQGRFENAERALRQALTLNPALPQAQMNLGRLLLMQNRLAEALPHLQSYIRLQPSAVDGYIQLGRLHELLDDMAAAEALYHQALRLEPDNATLHIALGRTLHARAEIEPAINACQRALQLQPNAVLAWLELGNIHREQRRFDKALHCYQEMNRLAPHERENYLLLLALLHAERGDHDEALRCYHEALQLNPNSVSGHWNHALLLLLLGRLHEGWEEYEWRWQREILKREQWQGFSQPLWSGETLAGRTLLIYAEQGLGDTIQFGRYLPLLLERGAEVIFHCPAGLLTLFQRISGVQAVAKSYELARQQPFDFYLPLMSLPRVMGTTLETIPATIPYLRTAPERLAAWRERIKGEGLRVGIVWAGSSSNPFNQIRSAKLPLFAALAEVPGVTLYSLQKGGNDEQIQNFSAQWGMVDLAPWLDDFDETAAAIENLDLVISVDTAVAHLAGALGKPVWTLIYYPTEWRWLLGRDDSPWYPTMRLFRQEMNDEGWQPVIERIATALATHVGALSRMKSR